MPIPPAMNGLLNDLMRRISEGELSPGSQIPSTSELAGHYNLSLSTSHQAVATRRQRGTLIGHPGRGVFVAEDQSLWPSRNPSRKPAPDRWPLRLSASAACASPIDDCRRPGVPATPTWQCERCWAVPQAV